MLPALVFAIPIDIYMSQFAAAPADPSILFYVVLWSSGWGWLLLIMPILFILVLFPSGKPFTPRWRWLIYWGLAMSMGFIVFVIFAQEIGPVEENSWKISNPIGFIPSGPEAVAIFETIWFILLPLLTLCCTAALFVRFRKSGPIEREQMKWLFYAAALFAGFYSLSFIDNSLSGEVWWNFIFALTLWTIPLAIGIAILRYRLFDIDIIIRKTLLYAGLTAVLVAVYFGLVLLAQTLFVAITGQESPVAIVISTLAIAALFNPLRQRLQAFIDRRFYRRSYNAALTLERFAQTARDEVDLEQLTAELSRVVQETMKPELLSLWLKTAAKPNSITRRGVSDVH
jgi:hypothetical protein